MSPIVYLICDLEFAEESKSSMLLPPPSAARVLRRRNTTIDRQLPIELPDDDSDDSAEKARPPKQPKRIARRRDTFCEVIDTPEKGDGSRPIRIKITTNVNKRPNTDSDANERNAKKPKVKVEAPPEIAGRPVLSRECKVVIEKLDREGLKRARNDLTSGNKTEEERNGDGNRPATESSGAAARVNKSSISNEPKRLKRIYNVDKSMHSRTDPPACALCSATPRFITSHYVNEHEGYEVCHARMPPETTDALREGGPSEGVHENNKISALCHYCEKLRSFTVKDWLCHITRHTGEYMRRCNRCDLKYPDSKLKPSPQCAHDDVGVWNDINIEGTALGVYVCSQCNYSQLLESNLQKHVRQMHAVSKNLKSHYDFVELISNVRKRRGRRPAATPSAPVASTADNGSETGDSVGDAEPVNTNVFESSEQGDGLFDTDTLQLMKETTFKESADDESGSSQGAAKNMMADRLSERFRKQDAIRDPTPEADNIGVSMECPEATTSSAVRRQAKPASAVRKGTLHNQLWIVFTSTRFQFAKMLSVYFRCECVRYGRHCPGSIKQQPAIDREFGVGRQRLGKLHGIRRG